MIYQVQPIMLESHLSHDLKRLGAATWTPIVVNGSRDRTSGKNRQESRKGDMSKEPAEPPKALAGSFNNLRGLYSDQNEE